ncbi:D-arabinitol 2-dehydrogenase [Erysiphe necator]|nr:D-arabinitol 2-dehydrogenase [Erysiphe necator]
MIRSPLLRLVAKTPSTRFPISVANVLDISNYNLRSLHTNAHNFQRNDDEKNKSFEGSFARTDPSVEVKYPDEDQIPSSTPIQGRGGLHFKRTLASFSLEGKVGMVTGGARGLGLVMAQAMVISGADLAIIDLNKEEAEKQCGEIIASFVRENPNAQRSGRIPKVTAHHADVSSQESVDAAVTEVIEKHVTSAGFTENYEAIKYPIDRVRKLWQVNVDGTYLFAIATAKHLMKRKAPGSLIFIGSMSGAIVNVPQPQAPYNASKAAIRHLAASLAVEWAHAGIRVNCISPGYMLTALPNSEIRTKKILDEKPDLKKKWTSLIPVGKMGDPEDLMGAVVFLASDASSYITGSDIRIDGGYTLT